MTVTSGRIRNAPREGAVSSETLRKAVRRRKNRSHANVYEHLADELDPGLWKPKIADECELSVFETRWGTRYAMIRDRRTDTYLRLTEDEIDLLPLMDGTRSVEELVVQAFTGSGELDLDGVIDLVEMLYELNFLQRPWIDSYTLIKTHGASAGERHLSRIWKLFKTQTVHFPGAARFTDWVYRHGGRYIFSRPAQVLLLVLTLSGGVAFWQTTRSHTFALTSSNLVAGAGLLVFLDTMTIFVHEMGHALAIRHGGRQILSAGFQLYLAHPAFFIDSTDMLMAPRRARMRNSWSGPYSGFIIAGIIAWIVHFRPHAPLAPMLFNLTALTYLTAAMNLIPFLELDGYWLLTDALDTPDLRRRSFAFLRRDLPIKIRHRERLTKREWGLFVFGFIGTLFTVLALATSWFFWKPLFASLVRGLWHRGVGGRVALFVLIVFVLGPIVHGLSDALQAAWKNMKFLLWRLRFVAQIPWRREAGEMIRALPLLDELPDDVINELAGRVELRRFGAGQAVVRRGDAGNAFYIVRRGALNVVDELPDDGETVLQHLTRGMSFGELALLEGKPRAATVRAETPAEVFEVDKASFDRALAGALERPSFAPSFAELAEVWSLPPFRQMAAHEVKTIADAGEWVTFGPNETVVKEGNRGEHFYVVAQGQLDVRQKRHTIRTLHAGDFFGEVALLYDVPRTATVRTLTPVRAFRLNRTGFRKLVARSFRREAMRPEYHHRQHKPRKRKVIR